MFSKFRIQLHWKSKSKKTNNPHPYFDKGITTKFQSYNTYRLSKLYILHVFSNIQ